MQEPATTPTATEHVELALEVARRFYLDDESKVTIAQATGLSRFQVARLLDDARRDGIVKIEIGAPGYVDRRLGEQLAQSLGIQRAIVVHVSRGPEGAALDLMGRVLADTLTRSVREGATLGLTSSRLIDATTRALTHLEPCTVVQLSGAISYGGDYLDTVEVIRRVARIAGGTGRPIHVPLLVDSPAIAAGLRTQSDTAEVLALADNLDVAVTSVGSWSSHGSAVFDLLPADVRENLKLKGAVGSVSGRVIDIQGREVSADVGDRVIGVSLAQLASARLKIVTSQGEHRVDATLGAVNAGIVDVLVVDNFLAEALLARQGGAEG